MAYIMESELGAQTIINSKMVDYYGGCAYLGFQVHPEVIHAACEATKKYGISSATSAAGFGNNPVLIDLEEKISLFFETQSVLHYASGCLGNFILVEGLKNDYDLIFVDSESHYSIKNATSLVQKPEIEFNHRDPQDLKDKLHQFLLPRQRPMIICDGIFPISGEVSPVNEYAEVLKDIEGAIICLDDAHATGVIGEKGFGTFEYFGLDEPNFYDAGVFSKALGGHGGVITGNADFIQKLKKHSALANACSSTPIPAAAATAKALEILHHHPEMRKKLWDNTLYAKKGFREIGFKINDTPVPIICLSKNEYLKEPLQCERIQKELFEHNIAVTYVPYGAYTSVPPSGAIRIAIFNSHSHDQIDHLISEIKHLL